MLQKGWRRPTQVQNPQGYKPLERPIEAPDSSGQEQGPDEPEGGDQHLVAQ